MKGFNFEGDGESARVQVKFKTAGTKWLISAYAYRLNNVQQVQIP
jgi:hypothetical protein